MKRRCLGCRQLIDRGSYCPTCVPRPADLGRIRGKRNQQRRAQLTAVQGGRCAHCGASGPLELHHLDHNPANDEPANHVMPCRRCHRLAGGLSRRPPADWPTIPDAAALASMWQCGLVLAASSRETKRGEHGRR